MNTAQAVHSSEGPDRFWAETHQPDNLGSELADYSMYLQDQALVEAVRREGAAWADGALQAFGAMTGSARYLELGVQANQHPQSWTRMTASVGAWTWCVFTRLITSSCKQPSATACMHPPGPTPGLAPMWPALHIFTCSRKSKPVMDALSP